MSPSLAAGACLVLYVLGYRFYARHLAQRVFRLDPDRRTPAHAMRDGVDYVPTNRFVLFGHHYASITGLAPMLGPAVAVIWGWVPAMRWVVLGAILVGCVHDFRALVVSMRAKGQSIGKVAEGVIGARAKTLFLSLIFFGVALAMGVFVFIIAKLFDVLSDFDSNDLAAATTSFPSAVLPSASLMLLAMIMGYLVYKRRFALAPTTFVGFVLIPFFDTMPLLIAAVLVIGLANGLAMGAMTIYTFDIVPKEYRGQLQAIRRSFGETGAVLSPPIVGILTVVYGPASAFWVVAPLHGLSALLLIFVARESLRRRLPPGAPDAEGVIVRSSDARP